MLSNFSVRRDDLRRHRDILPAVGGGGFCGPLQAAAAGDYRLEKIAEKL